MKKILILFVLVAATQAFPTFLTNFGDFLSKFVNGICIGGMSNPESANGSCTKGATKAADRILAAFTDTSYTSSTFNYGEFLSLGQAALTTTMGTFSVCRKIEPIWAANKKFTDYAFLAGIASRLIVEVAVNPRNNQYVDACVNIWDAFKTADYLTVGTEVSSLMSKILVISSPDKVGNISSA